MQLLEIITTETNRLNGAPKSLKQRIEAHVFWRKQELADTDYDLKKLIESNPVWQEKDSLLQSTPGV